MADKKITLHPKSTDGQIVQEDNIYPKTTIDQVYSPDGVTPYGPDSFQEPISAGDGINISDQNVISIDFLGTAFKNILLETLYPVNSIYVCTKLAEGHTDCPIQETLGGTWERIEGRMLMAAGTTPETSNSYTAETSGGSSSVTLTESNIPYHTHHVAQTITRPAYTYTFRGGMGSNLNSNGYFCGVSASGTSSSSNTSASNDYVELQLTNSTSWSMGSQGSESYNRYNCVQITHKKFDINVNVDTTAYGNGQSFSILPPYLVVYMWKRTA